jgi:hypothetical protein
MPIDIRWDNDEKTILYCRVENPWTWEDLDVTMVQMHAMLDEVPHRVSTIIDYSNGSLMPANPLRHGTKLARNRHPNSDRMILVGSSMFMRSLLNVFSKLYPEINEMLGFADTVEQARAKLSKP